MRASNSGALRTRSEVQATSHCCHLAFIVWLFVRFTFSRESRNYFQLKKTSANDPA